MEVGISFGLDLLFCHHYVNTRIFCFHKKTKQLKLNQLTLGVFWIGLAAVFNIGIYFAVGHFNLFDLHMRKH